METPVLIERRDVTIAGGAYDVTVTSIEGVCVCVYACVHAFVWANVCCFI